MMLFHGREVVENVTVFKDDERPYTFYLLASQPRFRLDENGRPILKFIKYRSPIERPDGKKGGFLIFDVEFVVPEETRQKIKKHLESRLPPRDPRDTTPPPQIEFADIPFTKGSASVRVLQDSGALVEKLHSPGKPSLHGNNVTSVTVELSDLGATVVEAALQGPGGSVQVVYDLYCAAKLPAVKIDGRFHAEQFYTFFQTVDVNWDMWGEDSYRETVSEKLRQSESTSLTVDAGPLAASNPELVAELRTWAQRALEEAVARNMITAATPASADRPQDIENVAKDIKKHKIADVHISIREHGVIEWNPAPQGTLPNITNLTDAQGNPVKWSDHAVTISADDPFFRTLRVRANVNADFKTLPIHSVDVTLKYDSDDGEKIVAAGVKSPDEIVALDAFLKGDNRTFQYMYKVNYAGADRAMTTEWQQTDSPFVTINVGDLGYLAVDVAAGDIDFTQVKSVFVVMSYEDPDAGVSRIEDQFMLTQEAPSHRAFKRIIYARANRAYRYTVTYRMADGKELKTGEQESRAPRVFVNDPFSAVRTVNLRTWGNLETHVQTVYLDLEYVDALNNYRKSHSVALSKAHPFEDWEFPIIRETGGTLTYRGEYVLFSGERKPIESKETTDRTLLFGLEPPDTAKLDIEVLADLIDFAGVKLAKVGLEYKDPANDVLETHSIVFRAGAATSVKWSVPLKDKSKRDYTWSATFYMADGTQRSIGTRTATDASLVLELPAN